MQAINWVDIVVTIVLLFGIGFGVSRGVISMITSVFSAAVGILFAMSYGNNWVIVPNLPLIVNYILLFFISSGIVFLLGLILKKILHALMLGFIDRILGGVVGFAFGFIIASAIFFVLTMFPQLKQYAAESYSSQVFSKMIEWDDIVPQEVKDLQKIDVSKEVQKKMEQPMKSLKELQEQQKDIGQIQKKIEKGIKKLNED
ncbi:MAG: CvpA family protein [Elusimicrobiota bacterium]